MFMRMDVIWQDDDALAYRASCANCSFQSVPCVDEDLARCAWLGHVCFRAADFSAPDR